jgi:hypothetical protein
VREARLPKEDYRHRAAGCLRLAQQSTNSVQRASLIEMARTWLRLIDQAEKNSRCDLTYETPPQPRMNGAAKRDGLS